MTAEHNRTEEARAMERIVNATRQVQTAFTALQGHFPPEGDGRPSQMALQTFDAALQELGAFDQARLPFAFERAARLALPVVGDEGRAALGFQRQGDAGLQRDQVIPDGLRLGLAQRLIARCPMSRRYSAPSKWMPRSTS